MDLITKPVNVNPESRTSLACSTCGGTGFVFAQDLSSMQKTRVPCESCQGVGRGDNMAASRSEAGLMVK